MLLALAAWPSTFVRAHASSALCALVNPLLTQLSFGDGGHAEVYTAPVNDVRRAGESVSSDAELRLSIPAAQSELKVGVNLRREFYLPLVLFTVAVIVAPVSWRKRSLALMLGLPIAFYLCLAALFVTTCWLFAHYAPAVFPLEPTQSRLLDAFVGMVLMPPTPRFLIPLLIAGATLLALGRGVSSPQR